MSYLIFSFFLFFIFLYVNYAHSLHLNCSRKSHCAIPVSFFFKKCERKVHPREVTTNINYLRLLQIDDEPSKIYKCQNDADEVTVTVTATATANVTATEPSSFLQVPKWCEGSRKHKSAPLNIPDETYDRRSCFIKTTYKQMDLDKESVKRKCNSLRKTTTKNYATRYSMVRERWKKRNKSDNLSSAEEKDEYKLINEYILLKQNGKSIRDLIDEGKWLCPKENIRMIRERTKQKINWNYILKKNNELLKDNVNKIYKEIVKKNTVNDIFFSFETYPYNYLNIPMSIFSLYKIASSYLSERKNKQPIIHNEQINFFKYSNVDNIKNDNFFSPSYTDDDIDTDLYKIKAERKRLTEILKNRNFQRIVGSINKHLKIIYKIFSTNTKLTTYEKNANIYQYIPYINIKDIITILKCFCILKFDHVNIFKYIYFFIIFFIEKFDIYFLTEAVYLCFLKKIYIKPLFQNYTKYLLNNLEKWEVKDAVEKGEKQEEKKKVDGEEKEGKREEMREEMKEKEEKEEGEEEKEEEKEEEEQKKEKKKEQIDIKEKIEKSGLTVTSIDPTQPLSSLYEYINVREYYFSVNKILGVKSEDNEITLPLYLTNFEYTIYESANYSNLNYSQDELKEFEKNQKETMKKFATQNYLKDKKDFLENKSEQIVTNTYIKNRARKINIYVYILYTLSKFPYTNSTILNILCAKILTHINTITLEEMILTFYSLAILEYDAVKLQNCLYVLILKNLPFLNFSNKDIFMKLIKALYLTNNLTSDNEKDAHFNHKEKEIENVGDNDNNNANTQLEINTNDFERQQKEKEYQNHYDKTSVTNYVKMRKVKNVKQLMLYIISRIVLKNKMDYTPIELIDIIKYLASMNFINKELFHFVFSLPFFKNLNKEILNEYKNNLYLNNSYYAYTKNNAINTPIEIMLCKLYQAYLGYQSYMHNIIQNDVMDDNVDGSDLIDLTQLINKENKETSSMMLPKETVELLKETYLKNMEISTYSSSSLHYEIADIILKDFKIPCHVEYKTEKGIVVDIAILYDDLKKIRKNIPFFKNIAIEINGPFHYKTKTLSVNIPQLNTKSIFKRRLLINDNWDVISFPFWEVKPWFSKTRKEKYILKMLPEDIKIAFNR